MKAYRRHHPWRTLRDRYPHIDIVWDDTLPGDVAGFWDGETTIFLDPRLTQRAKRCALEHETTHVDRGFVPIEEVLLAREEGKVDEIAARNLISLDMLADALRWCRGIAGAELAEEVWTDQHTLNVRLASLTAAERKQIEVKFADCNWNDRHATTEDIMSVPRSFTVEDIAAMIAGNKGLACSFPPEPDELDSWDAEAEAPDPDGHEWGA